MSKVQTDAHLKALDTLRGMAACGVFVGHFTRQFYSAHQTETWWLLLDRMGVIGVAIFFVLSGFLIHAGGIREMQRGGRVDWLAYARRRFWRIYPAYVVSLVAYALVADKLPSYNTSAATTAGVVSHLLLLSNFVPGEMHSINGVLWSVVLECHFYMLYPLFVWLGRRWSVAQVFFITLVSGLGFFAVATVLTHPGEPRTLWQQAAPAVFWKWALGALLAEVMLNHRLPALRRLLAKTWLLWPTLALLYAGTFLKNGAFELSHHRFVLPFLSAALVGVLVFSPMSQRRSALGEWLGDVSYSIYLWHPMAIAITLLVRPNGDAWAVFGALSMTLVFAWISNRWVEKPSMAMGKK